MLAFIGGFSSATSMVIVASIALSTMVSNHIVMPLWLRLEKQGGVAASDDVRTVLLRSRRISIGCILALGYLYYSFQGGTGALASIGLIAFLGVAQVLPALLGALYWQGATKTGALVGLIIGFVVWGYTLFLPSFEGGFILSEATVAAGPFGLAWLRPHALLGLHIEDPLVHAVVWSMGSNTLAFVIGSLLSDQKPIERLQSIQFINVFTRSTPSGGITRTATSEELLILAQRILGRDQAFKLFNQTATAQGLASGLPQPNSAFIGELERKLAGSVGAATAHAMISQITSGEAISVEDLIAVADETAQIMEYSSKLEVQSKALAETAEQLREANRKLTALSAQKDDFLSQVSHELRTPMTSIRSFSEILRDGTKLDGDKRRHFSSIIHQESIRLTRLLDEILDLSFLESGQVQLDIRHVELSEIINQAIAATEPQLTSNSVKIERRLSQEKITISTDADRLGQVFINLISNSVKYGLSEQATITIKCSSNEKTVRIEFLDNGPGISAENAEQIFQKFSKFSSASKSGSAGLGLPISREIMKNLSGKLSHKKTAAGACFVIELPAVS